MVLVPVVDADVRSKAGATGIIRKRLLSQHTEGELSRWPLRSDSLLGRWANRSRSDFHGRLGDMYAPVVVAASRDVLPRFDERFGDHELGYAEMMRHVHELGVRIVVCAAAFVSGGERGAVRARAAESDEGAEDERMRLAAIYRSNETGWAQARARMWRGSA